MPWLSQRVGSAQGLGLAVVHQFGERARRDYQRHQFRHGAGATFTASLPVVRVPEAV